MMIARVVGNVVSTRKHQKFEGAKLMLVQPLNLDDSARGAAMLAVDGVGAGRRREGAHRHRGTCGGRGARQEGSAG